MSINLQRLTDERNKAAHMADEAAFLQKELAQHVADHIALLRGPFNNVAISGPRHVSLLSAVLQQTQTSQLVACSPAHETLSRISQDISGNKTVRFSNNSGHLLCPDETSTTPIGLTKPYDLFVSFCELHSIADASLAILNRRNLICPHDGVFLCVCPVRGSLQNIFETVARAETAFKPHNPPPLRHMPLPDITALGNLFYKCGLRHVVVDVVKIPVYYKNPLKLFADLRTQGDGLCRTDRTKGLMGKKRHNAICQALETLRNDPQNTVQACHHFGFVTAVRQKTDNVQHLTCPA